jgi:GNAT superfamily N-acetyltransferase
LNTYRGSGIGHRFFDLREKHARALGCSKVAFCAVQRPVDHPLRPTDYRPLDIFWKKRGYRTVSNAIAYFSWKDIDVAHETPKPLQFWARDL